MTTSIGFVIQPGQPIPDDVTEVKDGAKSPWRLTSKGHWHLRTAQITCLNDDCGGDGRSLMRQVGQRLTVTAVREQPAEPEENFDGDPSIGAHIACQTAQLKVRLTAPEPQQADASPVLDLVQQYGTKRYMHGRSSLGRLDDVQQYEAEADVLLARIAALVQREEADALQTITDRDLYHEWADKLATAIAERTGADIGEHSSANNPWRVAYESLAALVPQQPVQARNSSGVLLWIHGCGRFGHAPEAPAPDWCPGCRGRTPGRWLPLLVGGDPAPEPPESRAAYWERRFNEEARSHDEDALSILTLHRERDEARAELERVYAELAEAVTDRESARGALRRVAAERDEARTRMLEHLGEAGEARAEVERLKRDYVTGKTWREQREAHLAEQRAAQPDPLVLSLPEVPEGTEALVGNRTGKRYTRFAGWWEWGNGDKHTYVDLLEMESPDGVTVELAPPREPRTWSKLDPVPDDLRHVRGASGTVYDRTPGTCAFSGYRNGESVTRNLHILREEDGPLDEVLK